MTITVPLTPSVKTKAYNMIQYKSGVHRNNLEPIMLLALSRIEPIYNENGHALVVTSTDDGFHREGSLHYVGRAVDIRIRDLDDHIVRKVHEKIVKTLKHLDRSFQVILKSTHIHIEHERRGRKT